MCEWANKHLGPMCIHVSDPDVFVCLFGSAGVDVGGSRLFRIWAVDIRRSSQKLK